ncbi:MAG: hypothetical protein IPG76_23960 [Acidobacteria bacterium]|nr:hypothetical protein [Acidobacteriota bacterium]
MQKNSAVDARQGEETIDSNAPGAAAAVDVWGIRIDPLTRVSGDFSINAEIDFKNRKIVGSPVYDADLQCIEPLFYGEKAGRCDPFCRDERRRFGRAGNCFGDGA